MLQGGCACGAVRYTSPAPRAAQLLICHCSMCSARDKTWQAATVAPTKADEAAGAPWAAVPRVALTSSGACCVIRSSSFACRLRCARCDAPLLIRYDCEPHTDWAHVDSIDQPDAVLGHLVPQHIHAYGTAWEPWRPDVCRPAELPPPDFCVRNGCFQLRPNCLCLAARDIPNFRDVHRSFPPAEDASLFCGSANAAIMNSETPRLRRGLLLRSSTPWCCDATSVNFIVDGLGIKRILDLRTPTEIRQTKDTEEAGALWAACQSGRVRLQRTPLIDERATGRDLFLRAPWSTRLAMIPVALGFSGPESIADRVSPLMAERGLAGMYRATVDQCRSGIRQCLEAMLVDLPVLVHCTSGKDRTGILCAMVLAVCGYGDTAIADDYAATEKHKRALFFPEEQGVSSASARSVRTMAHFVDEEMTSAPREVMLGLLRYIQDGHGSVAGYLDKACGFGLDKQAALRRRLCVSDGSVEGRSGGASKM